MIARGGRELVRLAVGIGGGAAAVVAGREAAVDAVAVRVVGDDEHPPLALRRVGGAGQEGRAEEAGQDGPHDDRPELSRGAGWRPR